MGTRLNRYYNNPAIGAAFENLAGLFAPPDPTDVLAYAQAEKARQETQGLESLYGLAGDPNADLGALDRWGAATGQWNPTSGFGARDMADATARRGDDLRLQGTQYTADTAAATSRANNMVTTRGNLVGDLFQPLGQGETRPEVPDEFMGAFGFPTAAAVAGAPKPLTSAEVEGQLLTDAITGGMVGPQDAASAYMSDIPIEQVIGEGGAPVNVTRGDAVGRQPYINPGSAPAATFKTYRSRDGSRSGIAVLDPITKQAIDQATGEQLPQDVMLGDVVDTAEGMTTGASTAVQNRGMAITSGLETLGRLEALIKANPAAQGAAGAIRGTAQDIMQTGNELGNLFGGTIQEAMSAAASDPQLQSLVGPMFDPNIPAIEMLTNVLAWQYAKSFAGDRVSNEQLRIAKQAIGGGGMFANQADSLSRLSQLRTLFQTEGARLGPLLPPQLRAGMAPLLDVASPPVAAPNGPPPRAVNRQTGETIEWNGTAWVPVVQ